MNFTTSIAINNYKVKIPVYSGVGVSYLWLSEPWMIRVLKHLSISSDSVVIDVGVNIGQTLVKLKSVYDEFDYIGFEPNPACVYYTEKLVNVNKWNNVQIVPAGVAESFGVAVLDHYSQDETDSSASIISHYRETQEVYKKEIVSIVGAEHVEQLWQNKKVSIIKIDVEGAELGVLKSLLKTIEQHKPYLLIEILPAYGEENKERNESQVLIQEIVNQLNYKIYRIHKDMNNNFKEIEYLDKLDIHSKLDWCDYIFSPNLLDF